jgi:hypothetical protein
MSQTLKKAPNAGTFEAENTESSYAVDSSLMVRGFRATRRPYRNELSRSATLHDVVCDLGEYVGDGVARTAGGFQYEPLDWSHLGRCA